MVASDLVSIDVGDEAVVVVHPKDERLDLFGVFVGVPDFKGQGVVADVSFDVNAKINLHEVPLLEHTLTVPTFNGCNGVIGGEVSR